MEWKGESNFFHFEGMVHTKYRSGWEVRSEVPLRHSWGKINTLLSILAIGTFCIFLCKWNFANQNSEAWDYGNKPSLLCNWPHLDIHTTVGRRAVYSFNLATLLSGGPIISVQYLRALDKMKLLSFPYISFLYMTDTPRHSLYYANFKKSSLL